MFDLSMTIDNFWKTALITQGYKIDLIETLVIALIIVFAGLMIMKAIESQRVKKVTGKESMTGKIATVVNDLDPTGWISVEGVRWKAKSSDGNKISEGENVRILRLDGLILLVERVR